MAQIKEFKGMMYDSDIVGDISSVVAPHCHASEEETICNFYANHPFNVVRLEYPITEDENKYEQTNEAVKNWLNTGILKVDDSPAIYIYEQEYSLCEETKTIRGIICKVKMDVDTVIPHENTNTDLYDTYKSDRYNLMMATGCSFCSVYSLYKDEDEKISILLETKDAPHTEFTDDCEVTHRVWSIKDENKIAEIKEAFLNKKVIIADGHVRYATAIRYREKMKNDVVEFSGDEDFNYVMMNLMPITHDKPTILPVHRIVKNRQNFDENTFIEKLSQKFTVEKSYIREYDCEKIATRLKENKLNRALGLYCGKDYYYILTPTEKVHAKTDADMLQDCIFADILGINKDNFDTYIGYSGSLRESEQLVREGKANCAFYLNPMSTEELYSIALCGKCTPKRSNSFYPKLTIGIVMNKFEDYKEG